jgi:hypothetical protein
MRGMAPTFVPPPIDTSLLAPEGVSKSCGSNWECDGKEECEGGTPEEVHGNIPESGIEVLSDDYDIELVVQLFVSAEQPFPWDELLKSAFDRPGSPAHVVVIALHYSKTERSQAWVKTLIGKKLEDLMKVRGLSTIQKVEELGNALYAFKYDERHFTIVRDEKWNCEKQTAGIYMDVTKNIRHPNTAGIGRSMVMGYLSVNLENVKDRGACLTQLKLNIERRNGYDPKRSKLAIMVWNPNQNEKTISDLAAPRRRLFPAKARRSLAAIAMRRLQGASENNPVCFNNSEILAITKELVKLDDTVTTWKKANEDVVEGMYRINGPIETFSFPSGFMQTNEDGTGTLRCFLNSIHPQNALRILNIHPRNPRIYRVGVKDQEGHTIASDQSSGHSLGVVQITGLSIFEYETANYANAPYLLYRGDDRDDDAALWVRLADGLWVYQGILFWKEGTVCGNSNSFVGKLVCDKVGATHYVFRRGYKTKHSSASRSGVLCNGDETDLGDCPHDAQTSCPDDEVVFIECYWKESGYKGEAKLPADTQPMPSKSGSRTTPYGTTTTNHDKNAEVLMESLKTTLKTGMTFVADFLNIDLHSQEG